MKSLFWEKKKKKKSKLERWTLYQLKGENKIQLKPLSYSQHQVTIEYINPLHNSHSETLTHISNSNAYNKEKYQHKEQAVNPLLKKNK